MNIYKIINEKINTFFINAELNLSGEINILESDHTKAIISDHDLYKKVVAGVDQLHNDYPYIEILASRELHEITIKFFVNSKIFPYKKNFFENFQFNVSELIDSFAKGTELKIRINFFGQVNTWENIEKFIIVNNNHDIYFKITECNKKNYLSNSIGKLINNYLLRKIF